MVKKMWGFGQESPVFFGLRAAGGLAQRGKTNYSPPMQANKTIKDKILLSALPDVPFDGWTETTLKAACVREGYEPSMMRAVFPDGVQDALIYFSSMVDEKMMDILHKTNPQSLRVRDRIALAVHTRLDVLEEYKEAERLAVAWWMRPLRKFKGAKLVWKTADVIWIWAGDTAQDYNHYTKRALLSGVLGSSVLFWLGNTDGDVAAFIERRIENVMTIGKIVSSRKSA